MIARAWWLLVGVLLAMVALWGAAPRHPQAPWTSLQAVMWIGAGLSAAGVIWPQRCKQPRSLLIAAAFLGRAAIVATGVAGFHWKSTAIASATYATLGVAVVLLHVGWEQLRVNHG